MESQLSLQEGLSSLHKSEKDLFAIGGRIQLAALVGIPVSDLKKEMDNLWIELGSVCSSFPLIPSEYEIPIERVRARQIALLNLLVRINKGTISMFDAMEVFCEIARQMYQDCIHSLERALSDEDSS